jgi:hypothetical protein
MLEMPMKLSGYIVILMLMYNFQKVNKCNELLIMNIRMVSRRSRSV